VNDGRNVAAAGRRRDLSLLQRYDSGPAPGQGLSKEYTQMWHRVWQGDLESAEAAARNVAGTSSARQEHILACEAHTLLCRIAFLRGDADTAAAALADAESLPVVGEPTREMLVLTMRSWVAETTRERRPVSGRYGGTHHRASYLGASDPVAAELVDADSAHRPRLRLRRTCPAWVGQFGGLRGTEP